MRVVTVEQMRAADALACERVGDVALMRRAGSAIARRVPAQARRVVAFAGGGNNGGDAFAALAELDRSIQRIIYAREASNASSARRDAEARATAAGVTVRPFPDSPDAARAALAGADVVLDGMLGIGADPKRGIDGYLAVIDAVAALGALVVTIAVDVPTGVDAGDGSVPTRAVRATQTVTLGAVKLGLLLEPGAAYAGEIFVAEIGIGAEIDATVAPPNLYALDEREFVALVPQRARTADKRAAGAPLIIAGSTQFPGAAVLCSRGAARAGAGYVTVATPIDAAPALRAHLVEQVVVTFDPGNPREAIDQILDLARHVGAVAVGPGLGLSDALGDIVRGVVEHIDVPFVADASALFHFAKHLDLLAGKRCLLTPHEREFARISGDGTVLPGTRFERLHAFVERTGVTTLLKGAPTLVDDGARVHVNASGTQALATAGTGDVLTGIIATLLAQGLAPADAARVGAYWHGLAGRVAARERAVGVVAGDVANALGTAYAEASMRSRNSDSSMIAMPSASAFASFDPAFSPATT